MLSVADFAAVQIFSTAALFITQKTEGMASLTCIKHSQHSYVWSIILGYEVSAALSLTFDIVMKFGESILLNVDGNKWSRRSSKGAYILEEQRRIRDITAYNSPSCVGLNDRH